MFKGDHDRWECFDINYLLSHVAIDNRKKVAFYNTESIVDIKYDPIT